MLTGAWQKCRGNYKPESVFEQGDLVVVTRDLQFKEADADTPYDSWIWEEYRIDKQAYETIKAGMLNVSNQTDQNTADIDYIATMADIEL